MRGFQKAISPVFNAGFGSFFLAIVLLSGANCGLRAQMQDPFSILPQGEELLGSASLGSNAIIFYTNQALYISIIHTTRDVTWTPPRGAGEIYSIVVKRGFAADFTAFVLTTTGQIFMVGNTSGQLRSEEIPEDLPGLTWNELTGDALYIHSTSGLVYVTQNDTTWQIDTAGFGTAHSQYLALDTAQNVYAATGSGIFEQGPSELTWHFLPGSPSIFYLFVSHADVIYAPTNNGIMSSADHGTTWAFDSTGMGVQLVNHMTDDPLGTLYATSSYGSNIHGVWMKPAGGAWHSIGAALANLAYDSVEQLSQNYLTGITVDSGIHVTTNFGLFSSYDGGATWKPDNNGITAEDIYTFYQFPDGRRLTSTNLALFSAKTGDTTWTKSFPQNSYLPGIRFFVDNSKRTFALGTSREEGVVSGFQINYLYFPNDFFISTDEGLTWNADTTGLSQFASKQGNYSTEFVDETGTEHIATYETPHMRLFSKAPGGSWQGDSLGYQPQTGDAPSAFATDHHGSIFLAFNNGTSVYKLLSRPITGGTAWSEVSTSALGGVPYVFTATKDGKLIGGGANVKTGYYDGSAWTLIPNPPGYSTSSGFAFSIDSSNRLWVDYGLNQYYAPYVFSTTDLGQHWTLASDTSPTFASMVSFGDTTYGLNSGNGLYYFVPGSAGVSATSVSNFAFSIMPNPSTGKGEISFTMSERNNVSVTIFNVLGQEVMSPVQGTFDMGEHTGSFDLSSFSPGTYYCRIQSDGVVATQKLVIEH
jgi:hypothetical protein